VESISYRHFASQSVEDEFEPSHYLIAFKDHSVYSAVAYWVDGDTLHYFTSGNTHNQVSVSLVDRDLTERLNKESGLELKLP
jgi:endonuclease YncB( thermonuclease family)